MISSEKDINNVVIISKIIIIKLTKEEVYSFGLSFFSASKKPFVNAWYEYSTMPHTITGIEIAIWYASDKTLVP